MIYALVKKGKVRNVIEADASFIADIQKDWDACVPVVGAQPNIDWDFADGEFVNPVKPEPPVVKPTPPHAARLKALKANDLDDAAKLKGAVVDLLALLSARGLL